MKHCTYCTQYVSSVHVYAHVVNYKMAHHVPFQSHRCRLKRAGLFNRKLGLQRLKSAANLPGGIIICEVFGQLQSIGLELERMHPKLYSGICRQVR